MMEADRFLTIKSVILLCTSEEISKIISYHLAGMQAVDFNMKILHNACCDMQYVFIHVSTHRASVRAR